MADENDRPERKGHAQARSHAGGNDPDRSADRREARSLTRALDDAFQQLGIDAELAADIRDDLASLIPSMHQLSSHTDVERRLLALLERDQKGRPDLLLGSTGAELDVEFEGAVRSNERLTKLFDTDEKLLQAFVANERLRSLRTRQLSDHDGLRSILVAELARRYTLTEQWRYKTPKFMDAVIAALQVADVNRDDLRPGKSSLLAQIIDTVAAYQADKDGADKGTADDIRSEAEEAARFAYNRFEISDEKVPPVDRRKPPIFDPDRLEPWPDGLGMMIKMSKEVPRSTGLSRSTGALPFASWQPITDRPPHCFMGFRRQPDLSERNGVEGPIEPADLARIELPTGPYRGAIVNGISPVLGQPHAAMLPPHSRLSWYGERLGWSTEESAELTKFGSPADPESISTDGNIRLLVDAFRGVAAKRIFHLRVMDPAHFLAVHRHDKARAEAAEDLARWWLFVLVARHRQAEFDAVLPGHFFHGVHGSDFIIDDDGAADFGRRDTSSYIQVEARDFDQNSLRDRTEEDGKLIRYAGYRRLIPRSAS